MVDRNTLPNTSIYTNTPTNAFHPININSIFSIYTFSIYRQINICNIYIRNFNQYYFKMQIII